MARRMATEPKAAFAGVMLATSFARLRPSIATFNVERTPSWPFGRWCLSAMAKTQGGYGRGVRCGGCEEGPNPHPDGRPPDDYARCNGFHLVKRLIKLALGLKMHAIDPLPRIDFYPPPSLSTRLKGTFFRICCWCDCLTSKAHPRSSFAQLRWPPHWTLAHFRDTRRTSRETGIVNQRVTADE